MAGGAVLQFAGEDDCAEVVYAAGAIDRNSFLAVSAIACLARVDAVDHGPEVDCFFQLAIDTAGQDATRGRALARIGRVGVVADHAHSGLVGSVIVVHAQNAMAHVAFGDVHDRPSRQRRARDREILEDALRG
jgi:hypothetical protein